MSGIAFVLYEGGPLHYARLAALAGLVDLHLVQVVRASAHYDWGRRVVADCFPVHVLFDTPPGEAKEERGVIEALRRIDPHTVFVLGYGRRFSRAAFDYALRHGKRAVLMSDSTDRESRFGRLGRSVKAAIVPGFDSAFVAGHPQARHIERMGMPSAHISMGYDVVDNDAIARAVVVARSGVGDGGPLPFLCVARLIDEKNLSVLIDAFAAFTEQTPKSKRVLQIAGYGPNRAALQEQIDRLGLSDRVRLLGKVDYAEMPKLYAGALALILPSRSETWGLVVNEAMAAGLPVLVSTACGCTEDLVEHGCNGYVFDHDDEAVIVDALRRLDSTPGLAEAMGCRSLKIIADWNLDRFVAGALTAAATAQRKRASLLRRSVARAVLAFLRLRPDRVRGFGG